MNHEGHGLTDDDGTPLDPDCCCRENPEEGECAAQGCGFCSSSVTSKAKITEHGVFIFNNEQDVRTRTCVKNSD